jgi:uncharacterized protein (TIRG00374 family)
LGLGLYLLLYILLSYRWQLLLKVFTIHVPLKKLYGAYLIGIFFNNFLPTTIGGDMARGFDLYRHTQRGNEIVVSIIVERFLGFAALLAIAAVALGFNDPSLQDPFVVWLILGSALAYLTILLLFFIPSMAASTSRIFQTFKIWQIGPRLLRISEAFSRYRSSPIVLIQSVTLSLILQASAILIYFVVSRALHLTIPMAKLFLFFPIINIISMIPISLGGLGLREGMSIYLFQEVGVDPAHAMGLSLAWFFILVCTSAVGGAIFALRDTHRLPSPASIKPQSEIRKAKE